MDRCAAELSGAPCFYGGVDSFAGHHTTRNAAKPLGESAAAQALAVNGLVVGAAEAMLRPWCNRIGLAACSAISVEPPPTTEDTPAAPQVLHRDEGMWGASSFKWLPHAPDEGRPEFCVSVMWASRAASNSSASRSS